MFFKKKPKKDIEIVEFYPCEKKDCKFRSKWGMLIVDKKLHGRMMIRKRQGNTFASFEYAAIWCMSCKHFVPFDREETWTD